MKIIVFHTEYGCDTGCCGHSVHTFADDVVQGENFKPDFSNSVDRGDTFRFAHPYGKDHLEFAQRLVEEQYGEAHVKDLDWEHCIIEE